MHCSNEVSVKLIRKAIRQLKEAEAKQKSDAEPEETIETDWDDL